VAVYKSKGIVLRSIRYGEADRILDLYTRDAGLVSAIAKGIRRTKSRFGARLEPLSCVDFVAYGGRTLDTITQAETLRSFHGLESRDSGFESVEAALGLKLSILAGYAPQLDTCLNCEVDLDAAPEPLHFAPEHGGVLCAECRSSTADAFPMAPGTLERIRQTVECPVRDAPQAEDLRESVLRVVRAHVLAHAPGNTRSAVKLSSRSRRPA
jgi:DNA repair protein RecO (recombination protein O)